MLPTERGEVFLQLNFHYNQPQAGAREGESRIRGFAEGPGSEGDVINKCAQLLFFILFSSIVEMYLF